MLAKEIKLEIRVERVKVLRAEGELESCKEFLSSFQELI